MEGLNRHEATLALHRIRDGDETAVEQLLPLVYDDLRAMARRFFQGQQVGHTLEPTALVHEAFIKLVNCASEEWENRAHFFAVASTAMRRILASHARSKKATKRGGGHRRVHVDLESTPDQKNDVDVVALDEALTDLSRLSARQARVVEMRFFGNMTYKEVSLILSVSTTTVENDWAMARAWLNSRLAE